MPALAFDYREEVTAVVEGIETFVRREIFPRHGKHARLLEDPALKGSAEGILSHDAQKLVDEVRLASAEAGFYGMCTPESVGGGGLGLEAYYAAHERLYHLCGPKYWLGHHVISHWAKGPSPVIERLTAEAKERYLARIMSGEDTLCFGLSEPGAGSDAAGIKTRAVGDGDGWLLSGSKIWTTNAPHAAHCIVFAITDAEKAAARAGGISAFLVPMISEGVTLDRVIKMWGNPIGDEAVITFEEVRIEPHQLLGDLNKGFATALLGVNLGRIYNSARAVGLSRWALDLTLDYVKTRQVFGKPISEYQGVTFPLAESAMQIHAAHLMGLNVARLKDTGRPGAKELSMAKAFSVETGVRAIDRCMQAHGAMGMTNELGLVEAYAMVRKANIADGTNEILRRQIVRDLLGGDTDL